MFKPPECMSKSLKLAMNLLSKLFVEYRFKILYYICLSFDGRGDGSRRRGQKQFNLNYSAH